MAPKRTHGRMGVAKGRSSGRNGKGKKNQGGYARKFDSSRLADIEQLEDEAEDKRALTESEDGLDDGEEDESEEEETPSTKPFLALMQSFAKEAPPPPAKKRKVDHDPGGKKEEEDGDLDATEDVDEVPEEDVAAEGSGSDDDGDTAGTADPFHTHFSPPEGRIKAVKAKEYSTQQMEVNDWRITRGLPGKGPTTTDPEPSSVMASMTDLHLKQKLKETAAKKPRLDKLEQVLYPVVFNYQDLLFCDRNFQNAESLRRMACLHALNHVFKTRDRVLKDTAKLAREGEGTDFEPRDQGFTRPKILMLLPTRQSAYKFVSTICSLYSPEQQENRKRFDEAYLGKEAKFTSDRPADFRELFEGNDDDMFRLGIKFTRKTIKYFSPFYSSDMLLASPLGLRMAIGSEEDKSKKMDYDFLSSIEIVILDQADALLMQNWDHVASILDHLNLQPRDAHDTDFSRVRECYLEGHAASYRQTLMLSAFNTPEFTELHRACHNWAGRLRVQPAHYPGVIQSLGLSIRQVFSRFEIGDKKITDEPDARFDYFVHTVIPSLLKRGRDAAGTLVFIPSYLDFVRVRNYLANSASTDSLSFGTISEYASVAEASRARSHFLTGRHRVLLYTGRAHHFRRYVLAGVRRVVFYGVPDHAGWYGEIAGGFLGRAVREGKIEGGDGRKGGGGEVGVRVLFSRLDLGRLERIVGTKRAGRMVRERGDVFEFV